MGRPRSIDRDKVLDIAERIVREEGATALTFDASLGVAPLPAPHGRAADARPPGDVLDTKALGREQDDAGTLGMFERAGAVAGDRNQSC